MAIGRGNQSKETNSYSYSYKNEFIAELKKSQIDFTKELEELDESDYLREKIERNINDIKSLITTLNKVSEDILRAILNEDFHILNNIFDKVGFSEIKDKYFKSKLEYFIDTNLFQDAKDNKASIYLDAIKIKNYFTIENIEITNLKDKKEIYFVGGNGDGKTILLQAIVLALKKEYSGQIIEYIRYEKDMKLLVKDESSNKYRSIRNFKNVFAYGVNRNKVRKKFDKYGYSGLFDTSDFTETTFLKEPDELLKIDDSLVIEFLDKLNRCILQDNITVEKKNNELIFKENQKEIEFDKLSEGYKSTIIWLCDLVSRLIENQKENEKVKRLRDFKAIVLIDEVDLYLHPKWKYDFIYNLRLVFPRIQFIMITHSTATILGASKKATFYKVYKNEDGETKISQPMDNIKNLMANNLSTSPLFDMETARARNSDNKIDTSEDFIYTKIHEKIAQEVKGKKAIIEDDIVEMINRELDEFLKENDL